MSLAVILDYLGLVRLRLDKASLKVVMNKEQSMDYLEFISRAHEDIGNLLAITVELMEQRNYFMKLYLEPDEFETIKREMDNRLDSLVSIEDEQNN